MTEGPLPPVLRRAKILERVSRDGGASLAELASEHAVSPVTVHRDLELLSGEGLLERVRGGARSLPGSALARDSRASASALSVFWRAKVSPCSNCATVPTWLGGEMPMIWSTANMLKIEKRNIAIGETKRARSPWM